MRDLIVNSLELLCKIGVVALLLAGAGFGLMTGNPFVVIACFIAAFIVGTVVFGIIFLLIDINDNLRAVRYSLEKIETYGRPE